MAGRITRKAVEAFKATSAKTFLWDEGDGAVKGFGVVATPTGKKSFVAQFRIGTGRAAATKRVTVGAFPTLTVDEARERARKAIVEGRDGVDAKAEAIAAKAAKKAQAERVEQERKKSRELVVTRVAVRFLRDHVRARRKVNTLTAYRQILKQHILPVIGARDIRSIRRADMAELQKRLSAHPTTANKALRVFGSLWSWAEKVELLPEGSPNPTARVEKFAERGRERFLTTQELERLGAAIRQGETNGFAWEPDPTRKVKHAKKPENRFSRLDPNAAAALRLLVFTGARLREILHLEWQHVDLERGLVWLRDTKTGPRTLVLNGPARAVLTSLDQAGQFVIKGEGGRDAPRADLKRPWAQVTKAAGLEGLRIHDLRHSFASVGAGHGHGLQIVGKLLGHSQAATTERYAHLDADPLRQASDAIAGRIAEAMGEKPQAATAEVIRLRREAR
ncbi:tyrosine-type recombinase/integrase [Breoghania sp.]|uniref:tyrosine-type recombinase/integrase n=1 Tax=Breoghania sp. TaxID=2065378 RepID=UPI0029C9E7F9|nr:tyrosine-type recombinase/integrase [Breoghania sp.]